MNPGLSHPLGWIQYGLEFEVMNLWLCYCSLLASNQGEWVVFVDLRSGTEVLAFDLTLSLGY